MKPIDCEKCGNNQWIPVWLSDDLEGYRCKNCGNEEVDIMDYTPESLVKWLEDLILQLEDAEAPVAEDEYDEGYNAGSLDVEKFIVNKLKYALETYKKNNIEYKILDINWDFSKYGSRIKYAVKDIGFGEITFYTNKKENGIIIESEFMGKEFVKYMLNYLVDNAKLEN